MPGRYAAIASPACTICAPGLIVAVLFNGLILDVFQESTRWSKLRHLQIAQLDSSPVLRARLRTKHALIASQECHYESDCAQFDLCSSHREILHRWLKYGGAMRCWHVFSEQWGSLRLCMRDMRRR